MKLATQKPKITWSLLIFLAILIIGVGIRLIRVTDPPLDFAAWRELRSATIARGMYYQMNTSADADIRSKAVQLGKMFEILEPNIFERLVATTYLAIGKEVLWVARIYAILFWTIGGLALYDLLRRLTEPAGALTGLALYLFTPFGIYASRAFMPDPLMVMWILLCLNVLYRWTTEKTWKWALLTGICGGIAILVKVFAVYFVGVVSILMVLAAYGIWRWIKSPQVWTAVAIMGIIPSTYYFFGIPGLAGNYLGGWVAGFSNLLTSVRFYFNWLDTLGDQYNLGVIFLGVLGAFAHRTRQGRTIALGLWIGYILFGMSVPSLVLTHPYYNLALIPALAFSIAPLGEMVASRFSQLPRLLMPVAAGAILLTAAYPCWLARNNLVANDNSLEPTIWSRIGESLPKDSSFIGLTHDYNTRLIYYGWTYVSQWPNAGDLEMSVLGGGNNDPNDPAWNDIFKERTKGFDYFIITIMNEFDKQPMLKKILFDNYPYTQGDGYYLFDLQHPLNEGAQ